MGDNFDWEEEQGTLDGLCGVYAVVHAVIGRKNGSNIATWQNDRDWKQSAEGLGLLPRSAQSLRNNNQHSRSFINNQHDSSTINTIQQLFSK